METEKTIGHSNKEGTGVIVGRFQTPALTTGHRYLIDHVLRRHKRVIIFIGVGSGQPTKRNPLSFKVRHKMLQTEYPEAILHALYDDHSDANWCEQLDAKIAGQGIGSEPVTLYGSRDSFVKTYTGQFKALEIETPHSDTATEIRAMASKINLPSNDFRSGIIHAIYNRFPSPYLAVDVAMIRETLEPAGDFFNKKVREVLFGKKPREPFYRFIGGFVDAGDESIASAAYRELKEEVGDIAASEFRLIGEARIDDWRYRSDEENIFTNLFVCKYISGQVKAQDDIEEVKWIAADEIKNTQFMPAHQPLVKILLEYFKEMETADIISNTLDQEN